MCGVSDLDNLNLERPAEPKLLPRPRRRRRAMDDASSSSSGDSEFFMLAQRAVHSAASASKIYLEPWYNKSPWHTSVLTGKGWVAELLEGHPRRIRTVLGVEKEVFREIITVMKGFGQVPSRRVTLEEKLAIFLYICVTGISFSHARERFQRSGDTISKAFNDSLTFFSSPPFYNSFVRLPEISAPIPPEIAGSEKFFPFFADAIGAADGSKIDCYPTSLEKENMRDWQGCLSQNCLAVCGFDMKIFYILPGWDGSAADSTVFYDARITDLPIPAGKYYLADAGFPSCDALLTPYRGVRYHLKEEDQAIFRPETKEELFNLRHAMARNVIERVFGVLKRRFRILRIAPEISMDAQARIPAALAAIHNFCTFELPGSIENPPDSVDNIFYSGRYGELAAGHIAEEEKERADARRDAIAQSMWERYQSVGPAVNV